MRLGPVVLIALLLAPSGAAARAQSSTPSCLDITLTQYIAGHAVGASHEAGHAAAALLTAVAITDVPLQWDEIGDEWKVLTGRTPFPDPVTSALIVREPRG